MIPSGKNTKQIRCATFVFTVNGYYQMFEGMKVLTRRHAMDKIPAELPVIFVSGAEDPVGSNGVGVTRVFRNTKHTV